MILINTVSTEYNVFHALLANEPTLFSKLPAIPAIYESVERYKSESYIFKPAFFFL